MAWGSYHLNRAQKGGSTIDGRSPAAIPLFSGFFDNQIPYTVYIRTAFLNAHTCLYSCTQMVIPGSNMFNKLVENNQKPPGMISRCPDHHFLGGGFTYFFNVHPYLGR